MAAPIDSALYRMKAYGKLLLDSTTDDQKGVGADIVALVEWIEYARPLLGAISPDQVMSQVQNQAQVMPPKPEGDDTPGPTPAEASVEDKPAV